MIKRIILFLILNFIALAIGGMFTGEGVPSEWYQSINKAPWTPPGWVFGAAWTTIMISFAIYMAYLLQTKVNHIKVIILFVIQWILNIAWNPIFFSAHYVLFGLIVISFLTFLVGYLFLTFYKDLKITSWFISPYLIWLLIATSLNAYIYIYN